MLRHMPVAGKGCPAAQALKTIPGIGVLISVALAAHVADSSVFWSGRDFAAWMGLAPRQNSSGGKDRLGRITKQGNPYLRRLLVLGATREFVVVTKGDRSALRLDAESVATPPGAARHCCPRQQDGPYRLGDHDDR